MVFWEANCFSPSYLLKTYTFWFSEKTVSQKMSQNLFLKAFIRF